MDGTGSTAAARSVGIAGREGREEVAPSAGCWCPRGPPAERKKYIYTHHSRLVQDVMEQCVLGLSPQCTQRGASFQLFKLILTEELLWRAVPA